MEQSALLTYFSTEMRTIDATAPLHRRLRNVIENAVKTGVLKPGAVLPGERVMAEGLALSRVTVRKALAGLIDHGLLVSLSGQPAAVAPGAAGAEDHR